jgi:hypothetical protein
MAKLCGLQWGLWPELGTQVLVVLPLTFKILEDHFLLLRFCLLPLSKSSSLNWSFHACDYTLFRCSWLLSQGHTVLSSIMGVWLTHHILQVCELLEDCIHVCFSLHSPRFIIVCGTKWNSVSACWMDACVYHHSTHICGNPSTSHLISGWLHQAYLWLVSFPTSWTLLFPLVPCTVYSEQRSQNDYFVTENRSCHVCAQNLLTASHLTLSKSQTLT